MYSYAEKSAMFFNNSLYARLGEPADPVDLKSTADKRTSSNLVSRTKIFAPLVKLVDTPDLGSGTERCESSSLLGGTILKHICFCY